MCPTALDLYQAFRIIQTWIQLLPCMYPTGLGLYQAFPIIQIWIQVLLFKSILRRTLSWRSKRRVRLSSTEDAGEQHLRNCNVKGDASYFHPRSCPVLCASFALDLSIRSIFSAQEFCTKFESVPAIWVKYDCMKRLSATERTRNPVHSSHSPRPTWLYS